MTGFEQKLKIVKIAAAISCLEEYIDTQSSRNLDCFEEEQKRAEKSGTYACRSTSSDSKATGEDNKATGDKKATGESKECAVITTCVCLHLLFQLMLS